MKRIVRTTVQKRRLTILEVLIAFFLVVVCLLPLVFPHTAIYLAQQEFIQTIACDRIAGFVFLDVLEKLHKNEIPWEDIKNGTVFSIPDQLLVEHAAPFKGTYRFFPRKDKIDDDSKYAVYLFDVLIQFENPRQKANPNPDENPEESANPCTYSYLTVMIHDPKQTGGPKKKKVEKKIEEVTPT